MERFGPGGNGQSGPLPEVVLFDQLVRQKFWFPVPLELVNAVKMADGLDVSVF